jgi:hypothetical protein
MSVRSNWNLEKPFLWLSRKIARDPHLTFLYDEYSEMNRLKYFGTSTEARKAAAQRPWLKQWMAKTFLSAECERAFLDGGFDSRHKIYRMSEEQLVTCGISKPGHLQWVRNEIQKLQNAFPIVGDPLGIRNQHGVFYPWWVTYDNDRVSHSAFGAGTNEQFASCCSTQQQIMLMLCLSAFPGDLWRHMLSFLPICKTEQEWDHRPWLTSFLRKNFLSRQTVETFLEKMQRLADVGIDVQTFVGAMKRNDLIQCGITKPISLARVQVGVEALQRKIIASTFGGDCNETSNTTYRRYEPKRNEKFVSDKKDLPLHLIKQLNEAEKVNERNKKLENDKKNQIKCKCIYYNDNRYNTSNNLYERQSNAMKISNGEDDENEIEPVDVLLSKKMSINDIKRKLGEAWGLNVEKERVEDTFTKKVEDAKEAEKNEDGKNEKVEDGNNVVLLDDLRLWEWDNSKSYPTKPMTLKYLTPSYSYYSKTVMLERKKSSDKFITYDNDTMHIFVKLHIPANEKSNEKCNEKSNEKKDSIKSPPLSPTSIATTTASDITNDNKEDDKNWDKWDDDDDDDEEEEEEQNALGKLTRPYPLRIHDSCMLNDIISNVESLYSINTKTHYIRVMLIKEKALYQGISVTVLNDKKRS